MALIDPIHLSALNHWDYCPHRCGLIYMEGEFTDNIHTSRGNAEHERVDRAMYVTGKAGARVEYALPVWSDLLGLIGKCDVVEF
jgi:CRISPR-associated exonuclease Cas4